MKRGYKSSSSSSSASSGRSRHSSGTSELRIYAPISDAKSDAEYYAKLSKVTHQMKKQKIEPKEITDLKSSRIVPSRPKRESRPVQRYGNLTNKPERRASNYRTKWSELTDSFNSLTLKKPPSPRAASGKPPSPRAASGKPVSPRAASGKPAREARKLYVIPAKR